MSIDMKYSHESLCKHRFKVIWTYYNSAGIIAIHRAELTKI